MKIQISSNYVLKQIEDEYIIIPLGQEAINLKGVLKVNEVGAFLFRQMQDGIEIDALVDKVLAEYNIETKDEVRADIDNFIIKLKDNKII